jgi:molybdopterin-binding protein
MLGEGVSRLKTQTKKYILISTTTLVTISLVTISLVTSLITITAITIMTMRASGETFLVEAHTPQ